MFDSIRARMTLWYTAVLAVLLIVVAGGTYLFFARAMQRRTDVSLAGLTAAFRTTLESEFKDQTDADPLRAAVQETLDEFQFRDHIFAVLDADGRLLAASNNQAARRRAIEMPDFSQILSQPAFRSLVGASAQSNRAFSDIELGATGDRSDEKFRAHARGVSVAGSKLTIVVIQSLRREQELLQDIGWTFLWVIPLALLLASLGGYYLGRKGLAPVVAMSEQAGHISAANLHQRLPVQNERDELGYLARTFNNLLERLEQSFEQQRRFMADASHELRSPIAVISGESEVALTKASRPPEEYRESLEVIQQEGRRLSRIVEDLFTMARADAGQYPLNPSVFYLDELVSDCVRAARSSASSRRIALAYQPTGELPVCADEALIRRMTMNLLHNAIKYTPEDGQISVECKFGGSGDAVITVTNSGPPIPADLHERIFERFFRAEKARSHAEAEVAGAGLGLPIARWIAEAHKGRLRLVRSDSTGTTFEAVIPAAHAAVPAVSVSR